MDSLLSLPNAHLALRGHHAARDYQLLVLVELLVCFARGKLSARQAVELLGGDPERMLMLLGSGIALEHAWKSAPS